MYYVYFAKSLKNDKVYVGSTIKKPERRIDEHNSSSNVWSKQNGPFELIYYERYRCLQDAKQREAFYKSGFGRRIKKLIINTTGSSSVG